MVKPKKKKRSRKVRKVERVAKKVTKKKPLFARIFRRKKERKPILPEKVRPWISGIVMLLITIFILFSFFNLAGIAGRDFLKIFDFLAGKASFTLPLVFFLGGLSFFSLRQKNKWSVILAMTILFLGVAGILSGLEIHSLPKTEFHFFQTGQGGWLGNIMAWPLIKIFGFWLTEIIFSGLIIISVLIFWFFLHFERAQEEEIVQEEVPADETAEKQIKEPFIHKVFSPKFKVSKVEEKESGETKEEKEEKEEHKKGAKTLIPGMTKKSAGSKNVSNDKNSLLESDWNFPPLSLLSSDRGSPHGGDVKANVAIIKRTLENFGIPAEMSNFNIGPTVTQYTLKPAEGIKLSKITTLNNNLSLALAAHPIRIEAPIPGKSLVGIEVPNQIRTLVRLRGLLASPDFQESRADLLFSVGRDVLGQPFYGDLARMPHLLVAGATGSGKTICLSGIILSLLYHNSPEQLRFVLVDPKRVEFTGYNGIPHLLCPVIYDVQKTLIALRWLAEEMERRFDILSQLKVRNITEYNEKLKSYSAGLSEGNETMPYIVFIIDELADLMAAKGRDVEAGIVKLAQKARAVGIHLILATQRPSVEVITGLIKANITARIAFKVASQVDSRTILDASGAEKLLGRGDLLFVSSEYSKPKRIQGAYVSGKEVEQTVNFIIKNNKVTETEDDLAKSISSEIEKVNRFGSVVSGGEVLDPVYQEAKELVLEAKKASASFLQRKLRIGYARAARLLDMLEERGVVGPADGAKPREVFMDEDAIIQDHLADQKNESEEEDEQKKGEFEQENETQDSYIQDEEYSQKQQEEDENKEEDEDKDEDEKERGEEGEEKGEEERSKEDKDDEETKSKEDKIDE